MSDPIKVRPEGRRALAKQLGLCAAVAGVLLAVGAESPAQTSTTGSKTEASAGTADSTAAWEIPKSVFVVDDLSARDPFFPESDRRWTKNGAVDTSEDIGVDALVERYVSLRGITGQAGDKVALLNSKPCKIGDTVTLKLPGNRELEVKLIKVSEDSVVITVTGSTRQYEKRLSVFGLEPR